MQPANGRPGMGEPGLGEGRRGAGNSEWRSSASQFVSGGTATAGPIKSGGRDRQKNGPKSRHSRSPTRN
jgi:hypothetical protein